MRAVVTVVGKYTVGIIAKISKYCSDHNVNIIDISQSVLSEFFCMIMVIDLQNSNVNFSDMVDNLEQIGKSMNLSIHVMHEDIFNSMHRI